MPGRLCLSLLPFLLLIVGTVAAEESIDLDVAEVEFFEDNVRPILVARCYECHSERAEAREGGLWLDRKAAWQVGGDAGPAIIPHRPEKSLLMQAIEYRDERLQMPPDGKMPPEEIAVLRRWIRLGAPDPRDGQLANAIRTAEIDYDQARQQWAYRTYMRSGVPTFDDTRLRDRVDAHIFDALHQQGLTPSRDAPPARFLRRLYFDLSGLPPTPEEVDRFAANPSETALERIVDRLLASPSFGETWGRHWLDVVRYSDSNGGDINWHYPQAWRYRDYVIDSFNQDRSYYEFIQHQIAGDLLPATTDDQRREQLIASTFLSLGPKQLTERDKEKLRLDVADEQVDTIGRALLGLTLGCARCHDHKFDPISQHDYYALAGIFRSTQVVMGTRDGCVNGSSWVEQPLPAAQQYAKLANQVEQLELVMRLAVERGFKDKAGGKMTLDGLPLAGIIYDESDAERIGQWEQVSQSEHGFGPSYIHDAGEGKGAKRLIFRGNLPENAIYEIRIAYRWGPDQASSVPITVEAEDGSHRVLLDQTKVPQIAELLQPIGHFRLEKGRTITVTVDTHGTSGPVSIDALQFIALADIERESRALTGQEREIDKLSRLTLDELKSEVKKRLDALRDSELAMAPRDAQDAGDIHLRIRGESGRRGPLIRRGFPRVLSDRSPPEIPPGHSGRLEFATWITGNENALLDRVIVNRVWHYLFGRGIVATVDNFGKLGKPPTHPQLLDDLAASFRANEGSIKQLIRSLVLTRTYRFSADAPIEQMKADPNNDFFGRHNRRRLTAEEIRDSVLYLADQLDRAQGGTPVKLGSRLNYPLNFDDARVRTVYLPTLRNNTVAHLDLFDGANPDLVSGNRATTNVPTQALFLLNAPLFRDQAMAIGRQAVDQGDSIQTQLDWLYRKTLNRSPNPHELDRCIEFIKEMARIDRSEDSVPNAFGHLAHLLLMSAEFLYLN